MSSISNISE